MTKYNVGMDAALNYIFIGTPDMLTKPSGLARRRVFVVIDCCQLQFSSQPVKKLYGILRLEGSADFSKDMFDDSELEVIEELFDNASETKKIMIVSDNLTLSRRIYCLLVMKILYIKLHDLQNVLIDRNTKSKSGDIINVLGLYDESNCNILTKEDIDILSQIEHEEFGEKSIINDLDNLNEKKIVDNSLPLGKSLSPKSPKMEDIKSQSQSQPQFDIDDETKYRSLLGVINKKTDPETLRTMVKSGMNYDEIIIALTINT
jgi:hypothetical protein